MLVRHQRALIGYVGGIILATALIFGTINIGNLEVIIFSLVGLAIAAVAAWYAFSR